MDIILGLIIVGCLCYGAGFAHGLLAAQREFDLSGKREAVNAEFQKILDGKDT